MKPTEDELAHPRPRMEAAMKHVGLLFKGEMIRAILRGDKWVTRRLVNLEKLRVKPRRDVQSDEMFCFATGEAPLIAHAGKSYPAHLNPLGAVSAVIDGKTLGLKPGEFDFVCPYAAGPTELAYLPNEQRRWTIYAQETQWWARETFMPRHINEPISAPINRLCTPRFRADEGEDRPEWRGLWKPGIHLRREHARLAGPVLTVRLERLHDIDEADALAEGVAVYHRASEDGEPGCFVPARDRYIELWDKINGERMRFAANGWVWRIEFAPGGGGRE